MGTYCEARRHIRGAGKPALVVSALIWLVGIGSAQNVASDSLSSSNVFVGYSFIGANLFSGEHANLNGWSASAEKKYLPYFGVIADISGLYGSKARPAKGSCEGGAQGTCLISSSVSEYTFQGGIRGSYAAAKVRPFAELLFGAVHTNESGTGLSNSNNG